MFICSSSIFCLMKYNNKFHTKMLDTMKSPSYNERVRKTENKCTSGSVVEHRLAKARAAGSNPVSCFFYCPKFLVNSRGFGFLCVWKVVDTR